MAEVKLFRTWSSFLALRIVWALKLKDVPYDTILEDLSNKSSLLLQHNPIHKKVPVTVHNGKSIAESLVILEYIEETWEQIPLLHDFGPNLVMTSEGKEQEEAIVKAKENLKYLEGELKGKKFFGGEQIGFTDIALGWLAHHENVFEEVANVKLIAEDEFPLLSEWQKTFTHVPMIKENWPSRDKLVTKFQAIRERELVKKLKKAPK